MNYKYKLNPVEDFLQKIGISAEIINFLKKIDNPKIQGKLVNELRKQPQLTFEQIKELNKKYLKETEWPYSPGETMLINEFFERNYTHLHALTTQQHKNLMTWMLIQLRKHRYQEIKLEHIGGQYKKHYPNIYNDYIYHFIIQRTNEYIHEMYGLINVWARPANNEEDKKLFKLGHQDTQNIFIANIINNSLSNIKDWYIDVRSEIASYSFEQAIHAMHKWHEELKIKDSIYEPTNESLIKFKYSDGWTVQQIKSVHDYKVEGTLMNHCVASYSDRNSQIFSLRDEENKPHITIEIYNNYVKQIKGHSNSDPKDEYKARLREWFSTTNYMCEALSAQQIAKIIVELASGRKSILTSFYRERMSESYYVIDYGLKIGIRAKDTQLKSEIMHEIWQIIERNIPLAEEIVGKKFPVPEDFENKKGIKSKYNKKNKLAQAVQNFEIMLGNKLHKITNDFFEKYGAK